MVGKVEDIEPLREYTIPEVAVIVGLAEPTIYRRISHGRIRAIDYNVGGKRPTYRIKGYDLIAYIETYIKKTTGG